MSSPSHDLLFDRAQQIIDGMSDEHLRSELLSDLTRYMVEVAEITDNSWWLERALDVASDIIESKSKSTALTTVVEGFTSRSNTEGIGMLRRGSKIIGRVNAGDQRVHALCSLARGFRDLGDQASAEGMLSQAAMELDRINDPFERVRTMRPLAAYLASIGQVDHVRPMVDNTLEDLKEIDNYTIRCWSMLSASRMLAQMGAEAQDKDLIERSVALARNIDIPNIRAITMYHISDSLAMLGKEDNASLEWASDLASEIESNIIQPCALSQVAVHMAKAGYVSRAWGLLERAQDMIIDGYSQSRAHGMVLHSMAEVAAENDDNAITPPSEAIDEIVDPYWRAVTMNKVAKHMASSGKTEKAQALLQDALSISRMLDEGGNVDVVAGSAVTAAVIQKNILTLNIEAMGPLAEHEDGQIQVEMHNPGEEKDVRLSLVFEDREYKRNVSLPPGEIRREAFDVEINTPGVQIVEVVASGDFGEIKRVEEISVSIGKWGDCPSCGSSIEVRGNPRFCPFCGEQLRPN